MAEGDIVPEVYFSNVMLVLSLQIFLLEGYKIWGKRNTDPRFPDQGQAGELGFPSAFLRLHGNAERLDGLSSQFIR